MSDEASAPERDALYYLCVGVAGGDKNEGARIRAELDEVASELPDLSNDIEYDLEGIKIEIAMSLKSAMNEKSMSVSALAEASGVSETTIRRVLTHSGNVRMETLHRLARPLGKSVVVNFCEWMP